MNDTLINAELIETFIKENNLSITKFCKLCRISPSTYKRIMGNRDFRIDALFKIAKILKVELYQMFN